MRRGSEIGLGFYEDCACFVRFFFWYPLLRTSRWHLKKPRIAKRGFTVENWHTRLHVMCEMSAGFSADAGGAEADPGSNVGCVLLFGETSVCEFRRAFCFSIHRPCQFFNPSQSTFITLPLRDPGPGKPPARSSALSPLNVVSVSGPVRAAFAWPEPHWDKLLFGAGGGGCGFGAVLLVPGVSPSGSHVGCFGFCRGTRMGSPSSLTRMPVGSPSRRTCHEDMMKV